MAEATTKKFKHLKYLWDHDHAKSLKDNQIDLLLYRSNILGQDLSITNYGGGNTSVKTMETDPLTGKDTEVMWIKGSGGDIGTLTRSGLAGLYQERLHALKNRYRGLDHEDEMVELFNHCIFDLNSKAPSIDTPLHAFLPFKHIDHVHPDAIIAIAASKDGEQITKDLFGGELAWVPWQRPGFDLGLKLEKCVQDNPDIGGIILGGHGLFTWGETAFDCYENTVEIIEKASEYLAENYGKKRPVFGGQKIQAPDQNQRYNQAAQLAPVLRGLCSEHTRMVGHFTDDDKVLEFVNSQDLYKLAPMGTSCPDHFLRTKIRPLVLDFDPGKDLSDTEKVKEALKSAFEDYRKQYQDYYEKHKHPDSPPMRDPNPVVILWPGIGMFTFSKNKQTARVASEFYINAINVMKGAEAISEYVSLPLQEAFNIEYWALEEAKLKRMPKEKPLSRKVALVTGSAGGIGRAIAQRFVEEGACVVLNDIDQERLNKTHQEFHNQFGKDASIATSLDVQDQASIENAYQKGCIAFGGVDIIVNCAGLSISKSLENYTEKDWDLLQDVLVKGQFLVSKSGVSVMKKQELDGDIINIVSKNALVSGPNNVAYGTAKSGQLHMSRLLAAELGPQKIRVNSVNPDAVLEGSKIWEGEWKRQRAEAYGIKEEELPAFYAKRTLLNEEIHPEDIANAVFTLVSGELHKSTGNIINVDGGIAPAFPR